VKRKKNRCEVDKLFVFGAGASFCATQGRKIENQAPLDKDFCARIENVKVQKPAWVNRSRDTIVSAWKDHIPFKDYGLEQAIIRHLGHTEFRQAIHKRARQSALSDVDYLNNIAHLICHTLRRAKENSKAPYRELFTNNFASDDPTNRVITFNYDDLLDRHFLSHYPSQQVYFDRFDIGPLSATRKHKFPDPLLIKLHGSVNWRCSKADLAAIVDGASHSTDEYAIDEIRFSEKGTPSPDEDSSPLIIPPLPTKPITRLRLFCFLWTKAYEYLHEANDLVICGYSLPETDRLAQSMFANFSNNKLGSVTIIDCNPAILSKWRGLFKRSSINQKAKWSYHETFSEYVASGA